MLKKLENRHQSEPNDVIRVLGPLFWMEPRRFGLRETDERPVSGKNLSELEDRDIIQAHGTLLRILTLHGADGTFNVDSG